MMQPTAKPKMTDAERIRGEPNISTKMMVTKTLNPRPINFGSPLFCVRQYREHLLSKRYIPRQRLRSSCIWTQSVIARSTITIGTSSPILHSISNQIHTYQNQKTASHNLREYPIENLGRNKRHQYLHPDSTQHRSEHSTPRLRTRQFCSRLINRTRPIRVSHSRIIKRNIENIKRRPDDRQQSRANKKRCLGDVYPRHLQRRRYSSGDESSRNEVLGLLRIQIKCATGDC